MSLHELSRAVEARNPFLSVPDIATFTENTRELKILWGRVTGTENPYSREEKFALYQQFKANPALLENPHIGPILQALVQTSDIAKDFCAHTDLFVTNQPERQALARLAEAVVAQQQLRASEEVIQDTEHDLWTIRVLPGAREHIPEEFLKDPYAFALPNGETLKHELQDGEIEIVWNFPTSTKNFALKRIPYERKNLPSPRHELNMLQRAKLLGLPAPSPLGIMVLDDQSAYLLMSFESGMSGVDLYDKLAAQERAKQPAATDREIAQIVENKLTIVCDKLKLLAERFRREMGIDKKWYVKDCLIHQNDEGDITDIFPLDWELAQPYNPTQPKQIDDLKIILRRREPKPAEKKAA